MKKRIDARNERFIERITAALKRNYFSNSPPGYLDSNEGKEDLLHHVSFRYQMFADFYVPWLLSRYDLSRMRMVEIGSGTGCSTLAFAPIVESIDCYELSAVSTEVAKERLKFWAIDNVTFYPELFDHCAAQRWQRWLETMRREVPSVVFSASSPGYCSRRVEIFVLDPTSSAAALRATLTTLETPVEVKGP